MNCVAVAGELKDKSMKMCAFRVPFLILVLLSGVSELWSAEPQGRVTDSQQPPNPKYQTLALKYSGLPLSFERNQGQADNRTQFLSHGGGYALHLSPGEAILSLHGGKHQGTKDADIHFRLLGSNRKAKTVEEDRLPGATNYLLGRDPRNWITAVPNYGRIRYKNVYPGIDLVYYGKGRRLEHDFVVAPGVRPDLITWQIDGVRDIMLSAEGDLELATQGRQIRLEKPVVYQEIAGKRQRVAGAFILKGRHRVGFEIGTYDPKRALVIDPVIGFSTFYGGFGNDEIQGLAIDSGGNIYAGGGTQSPNLKLVNPMQSSAAGSRDGFLLKLDPTASTILYSTYVGGSRDDEVESVAVDPGGNLFATGKTFSTDFPTLNAMQPNPGGGTCFFPGCSDGFVLKLNSSGGLVYSSYLGGTGNDQGNGIAVDALGNAYIVGSTSSRDFPVVNALQPTLRTSPGHMGAFITKFDSTGQLAYSTYLSGLNNDTLGNAIAVDAVGDVFVTGITGDTFGFPKVNPISTPGFSSGIFVSELNAAGSALVYSSVFSGLFVSSNAVVVDSAGEAYVAGNVGEFNNFPLQGAFQPAFGGNSQDAFVLKLNSGGTSVVYGTYLGGHGDETATGIAVDSAGNATVGGFTNSTNFPTRAPVQQYGGGILFKSIDGGAHWQTSNAGLGQDSGAVVAIDPSNPTTLYVGQAQFGSATPLSKSLDGGVTWNAASVGITDQNIASILITPTNTQTLYAGGSTVFVSVDGGATWKPASNGLPNGHAGTLVMDAVAPSTLYAATPAGVFKTTDGATTWAAANSGLPLAQPQFQIMALAGDPMHSGTVYASVRYSGGGGVYKTVDGANSWSLANIGITSTFIGALRVDPVTTTTVYAGTDAGYFKSTDGGATWNAGANQFASSTILDFAVDPKNPAHVLMSVASFSGAKNAFVTTDGGANWKPSTFTNNNGHFFFDPANSSTIYAAALNREDQFIARFDPNGALLYSSYLGGTGTDEAHAVAVDAAGNGLIAGLSDSADFPTTSGTIQPAIDPVTNLDSTEVNGANGTMVRIANTRPSSITLTVEPGFAADGELVDFTAIVTPSSATGTVEFEIVQPDGTHILDSVSLFGTDTAKLVFLAGTSRLPVIGEYKVVATYSGDALRDPSKSAPATLLVVKSSTTTSLAVAPAGVSALNQPIQITAVVNTLQPLSDRPTGTVIFFEDGIQVGTQVLQPPPDFGPSALATITIAKLTLGKHVLTANYLGDSAHQGSSSPPATQTVLLPGKVDLIVSPAPFLFLIVDITGQLNASVEITNFGTATACVPFDSLRGFTLNGLVEIPGTLRITQRSPGGCNGNTFELAPGAVQEANADYPAGAATIGSKAVLRGTISYTNENTGAAGATTFSLRGTLLPFF